MTKTIKVNEETLTHVKEIAMSEHLTQNEVVKRAIDLYKIKIAIQRTNNNELPILQVVHNELPLDGHKLATLKIGDYIILNLLYGDFKVPMNSVLEVKTLNEVFGTASVVGIHKDALSRTFERFERFKDMEVQFCLADIRDFTDSPPINLRETWKLSLD
ncbi:hypothetical protein [Bartonella sp. HY761]|uniref:hypothetical protein n=1 Tax=Bartonella sp. HY761 TaxID=2979330 RepID=UPI0021FD4AAB|nr:hypothetical protein [Bartonella sp. HY761]UXN05246.1 hypothetical protein N6A79_07910 [Bartonella sp. HY761]